MQKSLYSNYIQSTNLAGSNKASSYIKALDWLSVMLRTQPYDFGDCVDVWRVDSAARIRELYQFVLIEAKNLSSPWYKEGIPPSYLQRGYCSAALKSYESFLQERSCEQVILDVYQSYDGEEAELPQRLEKQSRVAVEKLKDIQGKDELRLVRQRVNQSVFRRIILDIYHDECCITGLHIPAINRASHIVPWAEDSKNRLDPGNGLCLSATYDAAFDHKLISLDDDYRLLVSKHIREYASKDIVKEYFLHKEGMKITLPEKYKPKKEFLAMHRARGEFS